MHGFESTGLCKIRSMIMTIEIGTHELKKTNERCYDKLVRNMSRGNSKETSHRVFVAYVDSLHVSI